jgi:hypothetical protein
MSAERVVWYKQIEFANQLLWESYDSADLLHRSLVCHLDAVNQSFINLGLAQGLPPIQVFNPIKDRLLPIAPVDEFRIRFFDERIIGQLTLEYALSLDCDLPLSEPPPPPPPLPDRPPEPFPPPPPGEPPNPDLPPVSDAYDGEDDGGLTYRPDAEPPGGDIEYPVGDGCAPYELVLIFIDSDIPGEQTETYTVYAPIDGVGWTGGGEGQGDFIVTARGLNNFLDCDEPFDYTLLSNDGSIISATVVRITPL